MTRPPSGPGAPRLAMVLAGGAARGAYEAGVLRYLYHELPRRLGFVPWPDVVAGASVGALNSSFVAGRDPDGLLWLSQVYKNLQLPDVFGVSYTDVFRTLRDAFRDAPFFIADPEPLQKMAFRHFPKRQIRRAVKEGLTWIVGATDLRTGFQVLFVDSEQTPDWELRPGVHVVHTEIRSIHTLASAALPLLFPPIQVGDRLLVDGGLRMNTPLRPVVRAGADKIIVLSLKRRDQDEERTLQVPNLPFLVGKTINALWLDPIEQDLHDAQEINRIIAWGSEHYGPDFASRFERDLGRREVEVLFIAPSVDLGEIAATIYAEHPPRVSGALGSLVGWAAGDSGPDADLLSYVYFDRDYTGTLEELGYRDARALEEEIVKIVSPEP